MNLGPALVCVVCLASCGSGAADISDGSVSDAVSVDATVPISDAAPSDAAIMLAPDPPVAEALQGLELFEGWTDPRALAAPVNTVGWEDSPFISADGNVLYFGYSPLDLDELQQGIVSVIGPTTAPERPNHHGVHMDIYEARIEDDAWLIDSSSANSSNDLHPEAAIGVNGDQSTMVFGRFVGEGDLYISEKTGDVWNTPQLLPAPINTQCAEDNPHLSRDGLRLYFDSNREDATGTSCTDESTSKHRQIFVGERTGDTWGTPVVIAGAPSGMQVDWQAFTKSGGEYLYWNTDCTPARTQSCVFRAHRQLDGSYAEQTMIMRATDLLLKTPGDVISTGEVSITDDGRFLYFVYGQHLGTDEFEMALGVARRSSP